jgi:2-methylaconitate cis-trans-isomerase PrpF
VDSDGHFIEEGSYQISGVKGSGSRIKVSFLNPGGTMTGKIFPTGNTIDDLLVRCKGLPQPFIVRVSLIDVSNPFIFIDGNTMPSAYKAVGPDEGIALEIIEAIRRVGSVKYGFAPDVETAGLRRGTPKIAIVSSPSGLLPDEDFHVLAYSMGKVHPSLQVTGAVCLGAAASLEGTVVWEAMARGIVTKDGPVSKASTDIVHEENVTKERRIVIGHGSGTIDVEVDSGNESGSTGDIKSVTVFRTARRLFEGTILVPV